MSIADKLTTIAENVPKVYEAGKAAGGGVDAGLDLFWETYQKGGTRTHYGDNYGNGVFTDETFKPKYTLWASGSSAQFREAAITNYEALKMVDFSKVSAWANYFRDARMTHLGVVDTRGRTNPYNLEQLFYNSKVETIDKFIVRDDGKNTFYNAFLGAQALANIVFEGVIGNDISFVACSKLTHDSIMSVINCLMDYAGSGTTKTLSLGSTNLAKLTDEEKAIATQKGWTLA